MTKKDIDKTNLCARYKYGVVTVASLGWKKPMLVFEGIAPPPLSQLEAVKQVPPGKQPFSVYWC